LEVIPAHNSQLKCHISVSVVIAGNVAGVYFKAGCSYLHNIFTQC